MVRRSSAQTVALLSLAVAGAIPAMAAPYSISIVGLTGPAYTSSTGSTSTTIVGVNATGSATGYTTEYVGSDTVPVAWVFTPSAGTSAIGFSGGYYENYAGYSYNRLTGIADNGVVAGYTLQYTSPNIPTTSNSSGPVGNTAWVNLPGAATPTVIGLTTGNYISGYTGTSSNQTLGISATGLVVGSALNYSTYGTTLWAYQTTATSVGSPLTVGLQDANHTSDSFSGITSGGYIVGTSSNTSTYHTDAWVYNPTTNTSVQIGLTDANHVGSTPTLWNNYAVAGTSFSTNYQQNAWVTKIAGMAVQVGLTDTDHRYNPTDAYSETTTVTALNNSGQAIGESTYYVSGNASGNDAYFFDGTTTIPIGFSSAPLYTSSATPGYRVFLRSNTASYLNNAGQVAGASSRFNGSTGIGSDAWFYSKSTGTMQIGLLGGVYLSNDGLTETSFVTALNASGDVAGFSTRYLGSASNGQDAWVYLPGKGTFGLDVPADSSAFASSQINYLSDSGLALGTFEKFNGTTDLGQFLFIATINPITGASTFTELDTLVDGTLTSEQWAALSKTLTVDANGDIFGYGSLQGETIALGDNGLGFVLIPTAVPEPASLGLVGLGAMALIARRRK